MSAVSVILAIVVVMLYVGIALFIILDDGDSGWKVTWLLAISLFPVLGLLFYLVMGVNYRRLGVRERLHAKVEKRFREEIPPERFNKLFLIDLSSEVTEKYRPLVSLLRSCYKGNILSEGNAAELITTGEKKWELLKQDIREAREYIHMEYFRFGDDVAGREIRDLLMVKAREGVKVRFVYEWFGNRLVPWRYYKEMREAGIEVARFTRLRNGLVNFWLRLNSRNHRKIVIIDGKVAYTGGMNLNNNYRYKWRDTHMRLQGPAIYALQASFLDTWLTSGGQIKEPLGYFFPPEIPVGEAPLTGIPIQVVTDEPDFTYPHVQLSYEWILQNARDYVYIQTPYFGPPESVMNALEAAALRGVDVRLLLPAKVDTPLIGPVNRSFFTECMEAGIRIYLWKGEFIHCKTLVSDDDLCLIGATNMDIRSFQINHEVDTFCYSREVALAQKAIFLQDLENCIPLDLEGWKASRKWYKVLLGKVIRLADGVL